MIIFGCIIILCICALSASYDYDHEIEREKDIEIAERRHKELMESTKRHSKQNAHVRHKRIRRVIKDINGNIIGEEIIEEY